ncbi:MAG: proline--tRNA ligase, partial [Bacteroidales bacterium]|nr:proline--tRNA ligase [Bacteroidales bacterium]
QNFAKAFDVTFLNKENKLEYVWATSWGVSTRLMGALIMTHSDDHGLVLPPKLAPIQVAIVPIYKNQEQLAQISEAALKIKAALQAQGISVKYDDDDKQKPGWKFTEYEFKGVPVRIAIGPRDMENGTAEICRRDTLEKTIHQQAEIETLVPALLKEIQQNLFDRALKHRLDNTIKVDTWEEFKEKIEQGKFILAHWDGTSETEIKIKEETKATNRAIPFDIEPEEGKCVYTGAPSHHRVIFAKAY